MRNIVIIMAGGLGKRMKSTLPKVLHPVDGIPMLVHILKTAESLKPVQILLVVGKYREVICEEIQKYVNIKKITFINQQNPLGTADAIKCCLTQLKKFSNTKTIILSGDTPLITRNTLIKLSNNCKYANVLTTILENPTGYGRIIENTQNKLVSIVEEKDADHLTKKINKINGGIYCFNTDLLIQFIPQISNDNAQNEFYLTDIFSIINTELGNVISNINIDTTSQYEILGVNNPSQLEFINKKFLENKY